ncbi:MAG: hypothetical protein D6797_01860 [Bdellovibrio sp.]|nr:MAG: hypothetical protein D6797_01860 [Bdellovibrio sp.]
MSFQTTAYGKWILCGEHSVLRGAPALAFPVKNYPMMFTYEPRGSFTLVVQGQHAQEIEIFFWGVLERALKKVNKSRDQLEGTLKIDNQLPLGVGLGGSAAFCVGMSRWFCFQGWIQEDEVYEFARQLENIFHGESSGVDIAVNFALSGIRFLREKGWEPLSVRWKPFWRLSFCGQRGVTAECVKKVQELKEKDYDCFLLAETKMKEACQKAEKSLMELSGEEGLKLLAESMEEAAESFRLWGLCEGPLQQHMEELKKQGALAVKPTGSGGGGYVLSLWSEPPPENLNLMRVF